MSVRYDECSTGIVLSRCSSGGCRDSQVAPIHMYIPVGLCWEPPKCILCMVPWLKLSGEVCRRWQLSKAEVPLQLLAPPRSFLDVQNHEEGSPRQAAGLCLCSAGG